MSVIELTKKQSLKNFFKETKTFFLILVILARESAFALKHLWSLGDGLKALRLRSRKLVRLFARICMKTKGWNVDTPRLRLLVVFFTFRTIGENTERTTWTNQGKTLNFCFAVVIFSVDQQIATTTLPSFVDRHCFRIILSQKRFPRREKLSKLPPNYNLK